MAVSFLIVRIIGMGSLGAKLLSLPHLFIPDP
jgi:hypothetical protein